MHRNTFSRSLVESTSLYVYVLYSSKYRYITNRVKEALWTLDMELGALVECTVWCVITASRHHNTRAIDIEENCFLSCTISFFCPSFPSPCALPFEIVCIFVNRLFLCLQSERTCPSVAWFPLFNSSFFFFIHHWNSNKWITNPHIISVCGHQFCEECGTDTLATTGSCPVCEVPSYAKDLKPDRAVRYPSLSFLFFFFPVCPSRTNPWQLRASVFAAVGERN